MASKGIYSELEKLAKEAKATKIRSIQTVVSGLPRKISRERMEIKDLMFYGSPVFDVEGAEFEIGGRIYRGACFLGYWMYADEMMNAWRCFFTSPKGMRFDSGGVAIRSRDYVLHSLCEDGGYLVPKDGGLRTLDDGHVVLLSPSGIFAGEGGWEQARKAMDGYRKMLMAYQKQSSRVEELSNELIRLQDYRVSLEAEKDAFIQIMHDFQQKYRVVKTSWNRFLIESEALKSEVRSLHDINAGLRYNIEKDLANVQKHYNDLLVFIETTEIDDSLRASLSDHPKILKDRKEKLLQQWAKEGIAGGGEIGEENKALKKENEELNEELGGLKGKLLQASKDFDSLKAKVEQAKASAPPKTALGAYASKVKGAEQPAPAQPPAEQEEEEGEEEEGEHEEEE